MNKGRKNVKRGSKDTVKERQASAVTENWTVRNKSTRDG